MRNAAISRKTRETDISLEINVDGNGKAEIDTGIGFFDHMLEAFTKHSGFDLKIKAKGDLIVDGHHLIEDVGIVLGKALDEALGDKKGIVRFGDVRVPMDEALAEVILDVGGRSYHKMDAKFRSPRVGDFNTQMVEHFFDSLTRNAGITMHSRVTGYNDHHMIEALFKAFAYAMKAATCIEGDSVKSTKGCL
ncbi:imidazoleglycerol-phosphate dehydratase HisB [Methanohalophilus sp.]|uniref:imidazoleglycerol-phosphate dehydratase HisB n=1 Tax=Methanohalophilus sp. TaxID=1966352 RepID=UPI00262C0D85|nr:imidazoleglycerol-phosphate dehydratase HisB [Methanohalophilus sp.]MDK2892633.1 imidazoleglycerol-phosphate dehydratase [Methanohalophilus sp.]